MIITLQHQEQTYQADLSKPNDISIPFLAGKRAVNCFYAPPVEITPVVAGNFIGDTKKGGVVNFKNVKFNPHGNGTHTECVGHIANKKYSINASLKKFHYIARVVSIEPKMTKKGDQVITLGQLKKLASLINTEALIIRTLPNELSKKQKKYSGSNPPYMHHDAIRFLVAQGVQHLLIDLPSVDREEDDGKLLAHKAFWQYPSLVRKNATITELIYVPNKIKDGLFLLTIGIAPFNLDASPSKPQLYKLKAIKK